MSVTYAQAVDLNLKVPLQYLLHKP